MIINEPSTIPEDQRIKNNIYDVGIKQSSIFQKAICLGVFLWHLTFHGAKAANAESHHFFEVLGQRVITEHNAKLIKEECQPIDKTSQLMKDLIKELTPELPQDKLTTVNDLRKILAEKTQESHEVYHFLRRVDSHFSYRSDVNNTFWPLDNNYRWLPEKLYEHLRWIANDMYQGEHPYQEALNCYKLQKKFEDCKLKPQTFCKIIEKVMAFPENSGELNPIGDKNFLRMVNDFFELYTNVPNQKDPFYTALNLFSLRKCPEETVKQLKELIFDKKFTHFLNLLPTGRFINNDELKTIQFLIPYFQKYSEKDNFKSIDFSKYETLDELKVPIWDKTFRSMIDDKRDLGEMIKTYASFELKDKNSAKDLLGLVAKEKDTQWMIDNLDMLLKTFPKNSLGIVAEKILTQDPSYLPKFKDFPISPSLFGHLVKTGNPEQIQALLTHIKSSTGSGISLKDDVYTFDMKVNNDDSLKRISNYLTLLKNDNKKISIRFTHMPGADTQEVNKFFSSHGESIHELDGRNVESDDPVLFIPLPKNLRALHLDHLSSFLMDRIQILPHLHTLTSNSFFHASNAYKTLFWRNQANRSEDPLTLEEKIHRYNLINLQNSSEIGAVIFMDWKRDAQGMKGHLASILTLPKDEVNAIFQHTSGDMLFENSLKKDVLQGILNGTLNPAHLSKLSKEDGNGIVKELGKDEKWLISHLDIVQKIPKDLLHDSDIPFKIVKNNPIYFADFEDVLTAGEKQRLPFLDKFEKNALNPAMTLQNKAEAAGIVPKDIPAIKIDQFFKLYDEINFTDPKHPSYVDISKYTDDGSPINKEHVLKGLKRLKESIETEAAVTAVPNDPVQRKKWYKNLSNTLKNIVDAANKSEDKALVRSELIRLGVAGHHCGGRWFRDATDMWKALTGGWDQDIANQGMEGIISSWIGNAKIGVLEKIVVDAKNHGEVADAYQPHYFNAAAKVLQKTGVTFPQNIDTADILSSSVDAEQIKKLFFGNFTTAKFIKFIHEQIKDKLKPLKADKLVSPFIDTIMEVMRNMAEGSFVATKEGKDYQASLDKKKLEYGLEEAKAKVADAQVYQIVKKGTAPDEVKKLCMLTPGEETLYTAILNKDTKKIEELKNASTEEEQDLYVNITYNIEDDIKAYLASGEPQKKATYNRLKAFHASYSKIEQTLQTVENMKRESKDLSQFKKDISGLERKTKKRKEPRAN